MSTALARSGAPLRYVLARRRRWARFGDGAEAGEKRRRVAVGNHRTFVADSGGERTLLLRIRENDDVHGPHVKPERRYGCGMGHEHLADRPSLEFSHAAGGDDRNPLALEALHQLLPSGIVAVDEHDRQKWIGEQ